MASQYVDLPVASGGSGSGITALTGDVSATGPGSAAATVNAVGGSTASAVHTGELLANAATNANTASTIVKRDGSGNFSAGTITATLTGNVTGAVTGNVTGDVNGRTYKASTAISSTAIDWSLNNSFTKTISTNTTFTFSNTQDGQVITVRITAGSGNTVTWPTLKWPGGTIPTQTSSGTDVYTFWKDATNIYGSVLQAFA